MTLEEQQPILRHCTYRQIEIGSSSNNLPIGVLVHLEDVETFLLLRSKHDLVRGRHDWVCQVIRMIEEVYASRFLGSYKMKKLDKRGHWIGSTLLLATLQTKLANKCSPRR